MSQLRKVASFLRWRIVPVRYATMMGGVSASNLLSATPFRTVTAEAIQAAGHHPGPRMSAQTVQEAVAIYGPRMQEVKPTSGGYSFVNLFNAGDISADNPIFRFAMSPEVLDVAMDYFLGRPVLDSIQVLYSWPTQGKPLESQLWHKDYGDSKSFHCVGYLKDVQVPDDGPFVFVDKADTRRLGHSLLVRRIADERFMRELGDGRIRHFYGQAGESVFVDPAVCYHFGSRCRNPRLAVFITFNTRFPFAQPTSLVRENGARLFEAARLVRPDLTAGALRGLLRLR